MPVSVAYQEHRGAPHEYLRVTDAKEPQLARDPYRDGFSIRFKQMELRLLPYESNARASCERARARGPRRGQTGLSAYSQHRRWGLCDECRMPTRSAVL